MMTMITWWWWLHDHDHDDDDDDEDYDDVLLFCRTSTCVVVVPAANIGPLSSFGPAHTTFQNIAELQDNDDDDNDIERKEDDK